MLYSRQVFNFREFGQDMNETTCYYDNNMGKKIQWTELKKNHSGKFCMGKYPNIRVLGCQKAKTKLMLCALLEGIQETKKYN